MISVRFWQRAVLWFKKSPLVRMGSLLAVLLSITGCSLSPRTADNNPYPKAWLMPGVQVTLPAPGISPTVNQQQLLTASVNGKQQSLLVLLHADQQKISLAGLSSLGIRLFLLTYNDSGIHTAQTLILPELPPASQVLADIMLSHWPIASWQAQLPAGWTLRDNANRRELRDPRGKLITEISYMQRDGRREPIALTQYAFHYHIAIQYLGN